MIDREKVIKGLEHCANEADCRGCVYQEQMKGRSDECDCTGEALALLKEQEAIQVPEDKINKCECGETVCRYWHPKFCGFCGRELLWY